MTLTTLIALPLELVREICSYLPQDALLAAKLTHPVLTDYVTLDTNQTITECARLLIRDHLMPPNPAPSHQRCILCKAVYPQSMFRCPDTGPDTSLASLIELPYRVCSWHIGSMTRVVETEPGGRNGWVGTEEIMCMHCGDLQNWRRCGCHCDSCAFRKTRAFTRFLNNRRECRDFSFRMPTVQQSQSSLFVTETCFTGECGNV
jgi:hypothetical protein